MGMGLGRGRDMSLRMFVRVSMMRMRLRSGGTMRFLEMGKVSCEGLGSQFMGFILTDSNLKTLLGLDT